MMTFARYLTGLVACAGLAFPVAARAAEAPLTLGIAPAIAEYGLAPGQSRHRQITVVNQGQAPVAVQVHTENFEAADATGALKFDNDTTRQYAASTWIKPDNPSLVISPQAQAVFGYTVAAPPDAEPGGHYAAVFFEPFAPGTVREGSNLGISQRIGALQFITVEGADLQRGQVLGAKAGRGCAGPMCSFRTDAWREWGPVPFSFDFQNTGNVHVKAAGRIEVYDWLGHKVGETAVGQQTVLPDSQRQFQATWLREVLFGRYTAKLVLGYGSVAPAEMARVTFWVVPWRALLAGWLVAGLVVLVWYWRRRRT